MSSSTLQRRVDKALESNGQSDPDTQLAWKALAGFFPRNGLEERRALRGQIERRHVETSQRMVAEFGRLKRDLDDAELRMNEVDARCAHTLQGLRRTQVQTAELLRLTWSLQADRDRLVNRASVAEGFLQRFRLTAEELQALEAPLTAHGLDCSAKHGSGEQSQQQGQLQHHSAPHFFGVLGKLERVRGDIGRLLLRTPGCERAGLELLDEMGGRLQWAYERLYRWCCRYAAGRESAAAGASDPGQPQPHGSGQVHEVVVEDEDDDRRTPSREDDLDDVDGHRDESRLLRPGLVRALRELRRTPAFLEHFQEELLNRRGQSLVRRFLRALHLGQQPLISDPSLAGSAFLGGGARGRLPPINHQAHDPVRYVGDMLAWLHQALAGERELLFLLLGPDEIQEPQKRPQQQVQQLQHHPLSIGELMQRLSARVAGHLRSRVQDTLTGLRPAARACLELAQVLGFYEQILIRSDSSLSPPISSLSEAGLLPRDSEMAAVLQQLRVRCEQAVLVQAGARLETLLQGATPADPRQPQGLQAPGWAYELLRELRSLLLVLRDGLGGSLPAPSSPPQPELTATGTPLRAVAAVDADQLLELHLGVLLRSGEQLGAALQLPDLLVFQLNLISLALQQLRQLVPEPNRRSAGVCGGESSSDAVALESRVETLRLRRAELAEKLAELQSRTLLQLARLWPIGAAEPPAWTRRDQMDALGEFPQADELVAAIRGPFVRLLPGLGAGELPLLRPLADPELRRILVRKSLKRLADLYAYLYGLLVVERQRRLEEGRPAPFQPGELYAPAQLGEILFSAAADLGDPAVEELLLLP